MPWKVNINVKNLSKKRELNTIVVSAVSIEINANYFIYNFALCVYFRPTQFSLCLIPFNSENRYLITQTLLAKIHITFHYCTYQTYVHEINGMFRKRMFLVCRVRPELENK